jgi:predicted nucleic-acid-binding Zn-ribbon protein
MSQRVCPKCPPNHGIMIGETQTIPKNVPLPLPLSPKINLERYLPSIIKKHNYYTIFICQTCGYTEFFIHD